MLPSNEYFHYLFGYLFLKSKIIDDKYGWILIVYGISAAIYIYIMFLDQNHLIFITTFIIRLDIDVSVYGLTVQWLLHKSNLFNRLKY